MKSTLLLLATLFTFPVFAFGNYYQEFQNHPAFKKATSNMKVIGRTKVKTTSQFGEGYDFWKNFEVTQKVLEDGVRKNVVLEVETMGIILDCGLDDYPEMRRKYCRWYKGFVELYTEVKVYRRR